MAWRRPQDPPRVEPPEWYRNYHPEAWDVPDAHELSMTGGDDVRDWPGHAHHALRRWRQAKYEYEREHPDLAEQAFLEVVEGHAVRRV